MKILCVVCEVSEAAIWCCGDEAPLCYGCDEKVHTANQLVCKHPRIPLVQTTTLPKCDICQEAVSYFFCREDRALLCLRCDLAVHSSNVHVSAHQRLLFTGVRVGPEAIEHSPVTFSSVEKSAAKQTCTMVQKASPGLASAEGCVSEGIQERELNDIYQKTDLGQSNVDDKRGDYRTPMFSMDDIDTDPDENLVSAWRLDDNLDADDNVIQAWVADHIHLPGNENLGQDNISSSSKLGDIGSSSTVDMTVGRLINN